MDLGVDPSQSSLKSLQDVDLVGLYPLLSKA
jgi:hypothetical protein